MPGFKIISVQAIIYFSKKTLYTIMILRVEISLLAAIKKSNCTLLQPAISTYLLCKKKGLEGDFTT
jgi:hypothetical protein